MILGPDFLLHDLAGDLHGGGKFLRRLLAEVNFCPQDELFLLGDYVEKGEARERNIYMTLALNLQIYVEKNKKVSS